MESDGIGYQIGYHGSLPWRERSPMTNETREHRTTLTVNGAEIAEVTQPRGKCIDTSPRLVVDKRAMIFPALTTRLVSSEVNLLLLTRRDGLEHG